LGSIITDATTSPATIGLQPGQVALATIYVRFLTVTVHDQFDDSLGDIYVNAEVSEVAGDGNYHSINQPLSASGTYLDPVGPSIGIRYVAAGSSEANNWPSAAKNPAPSGCNAETADVPVKVDGFLLNPSVETRTANLCGNGSSTTSPPVTLTISWPN